VNFRLDGSKLSLEVGMVGVLPRTHIRNTFRLQAHGALDLLERDFDGVRIGVGPAFETPDVLPHLPWKAQQFPQSAHEATKPGHHEGRPSYRVR